MRTHEQVGFAIMAGAEAARAGKEIYESVRSTREKHCANTAKSPHKDGQVSSSQTSHRRKHFDWALCGVMSVCAVVPAVFYGKEWFT